MVNVDGVGQTAAQPSGAREGAVTGDARYVATGVPIGNLGPVGSTAEEPALWVRRGETFLSLTSGTFKLWAALQLPRTETEIGEKVSAGEVADDLALLLRERLALALPQEPEEILSWHAVRPLAQGAGMGADVDAPDSYVVMGLNGDPIIRLSLPGYLFWAYSDGRRTVPEVVQAVCRHLDVTTEAGLRLLDPPDLFEGLVRSGAVRLDVAGDGDDWA